MCILLFSEVTLFEYNVSTILSPIEALRINKVLVLKSPWNYTVLPGAFEDYSLCQVLHWEQTSDYGGFENKELFVTATKGPN